MGQKSWRDSPGDPSVGRALRVIRTELGLNRKELAARAEISYPYLSEIETGKKVPSSRALTALAQALGVAPHEVLERADSLARTPAAPAARRAFFHEQPAPSMAAPPAPSAAPRAEDKLAELLRAAESLEPDDLERLIDFARRLLR